VLAVLDATETPARLVYLRRWQGTGWETQIEEVAAVIARFDPWATLADGNSIGDPLIESLQKAVRRLVHAADPGARVPPLERYLFTQPSKQALVDRLPLRLASHGLVFPSVVAGAAGVLARWEVAGGVKMGTADRRSIGFVASE